MKSDWEYEEPRPDTPRPETETEEELTTQGWDIPNLEEQIRAIRNIKLEPQSEPEQEDTKEEDEECWDSPEHGTLSNWSSQEEIENWTVDQVVPDVETPPGRLITPSAPSEGTDDLSYAVLGRSHREVK